MSVITSRILSQPTVTTAVQSAVVGIPKGGTLNQVLAKDSEIDYAVSWKDPGAVAAPVASVNGKIGVVVINKSDVGLSNVDNTADSAKPVSTAQATAIDARVEKVVGKGLSQEDFTTGEKNKLALAIQKDATSPNNIVLVWSGTQGQYDALTPVTSTLYFIEV